LLYWKVGERIRKDIVPDFDQWPESWMGTDKDLGYGKRLLPFMQEFIMYLIGQDLSRKTLKEYVDYLWLLGGTIIKDVSIYEEYKKDPLKKLTEAVEGDSCLPEGHENMTARELASLKKMGGEFEEFLQNLSTGKAGSGEKTTAK
jgi:hypothetical protein